MMQGMIQEFISNEIMDKLDDWKRGMVAVKYGNELGFGIIVHRYA
jgi:hypothetical protein